MEPPRFVTAGWLKEAIQKPDSELKVIDATWHMPAWKRDAIAEHESCRVKGAVYMDLNEVRDKESDWPNAVPSREHYEQCIGKLGVTNDSSVVLYDNNEQFGMFSVARAWLLFKLFGHNHVAILDGGLPKYLAVGGPTDSGSPTPPKPVPYKAGLIKSDQLRSYEQMIFNCQEKLEQVLDARSAGKFNGTSPEPNPNLYSGHMLGSISTPFTKFFTSDTKTMKNAAELTEVFQQSGVDLGKPMVAMCGSGIAGPWVVVAGLLSGAKMLPLYDNSWTEWVQMAPANTKTIGVRGVDMQQ